MRERLSVEEKESESNRKFSFRVQICFAIDAKEGIRSVLKMSSRSARFSMLLSGE